MKSVFHSSLILYIISDCGCMLVELIFMILEVGSAFNIVLYLCIDYLITFIGLL